MIESRKEAYRLLDSLGAPPMLIRHVRLVGEAAEMLLDEIRRLGVDLRETLVEIGVALHDVGKILHADELIGKGSLHERGGEILLLAHGVQPEIARCCLSHARHETMEVSLEELLVALSDKLWKGKRAGELETRVIDRVTELLDLDRRDVCRRLDDCFERIAAGGDERLVRAVGG